MYRTCAINQSDEPSTQVQHAGIAQVVAAFEQ